jgi:hypothetical protein
MGNVQNWENYVKFQGWEVRERTNVNITLIGFVEFNVFYSGGYEEWYLLGQNSV